MADGLTSAKLSHLAAAIATKTACAHAAHALGSAEATPELVKLAITGGREAVLQLAVQQQCDLTDLDTTIIVAVVTPASLIIGHLGDGAVIGWRNKTPVMLSPPADSSAINIVHSLLEDDWESHVRVAEHDPVDSLIAMTDGLQKLSLRRIPESREWIAVPETFQYWFKLFSSRSTSYWEKGLADYLTKDRAVLESDGDDKTMVVVTPAIAPTIFEVVQPPVIFEVVGE